MLCYIDYSSAGRSPSRCLKQYRYQSSLSGSQFLRFFGASCALTPLAPDTVLSSAEIKAEGEQKIFKIMFQT